MFLHIFTKYSRFQNEEIVDKQIGGFAFQIVNRSPEGIDLKGDFSFLDKN